MDTEYNNPIKIDGNEASFESGAIRYTKDGKGCFDLIPSKTIAQIVNIFETQYDNSSFTKLDVIYSMFRYRDDANDTSTNTIDRILRALLLSIWVYSPDFEDDKKLTYDYFEKALSHALIDLAYHYENGARHYGIDNWKKGIPCYSFYDSALRHMCQFLVGKNDENHGISAIWNLFGYLWTYENKPELRMINCKRPELKEEEKYYRGT